ncbi:hypothetical protein FE848_11900 [Marinobacter sp. 1-3A]|uniref:ion channel n=1 Tax=Marinobacter sp. 1-3A TaxID=2582920 RepID=UPI0019071E4A|nr:hypothetical protein [Marinobacter sp. 1-3A]
MDFSITFFKLFLWGTYFSLPILLSICVSIIALGLFVGRLESWGRFDALYWAFITAFTVGYGGRRLGSVWSEVGGSKSLFVSNLDVAIINFVVLKCSGQLIPDSVLSFSSATTGGMPSLNVWGRCRL